MERRNSIMAVAIVVLAVVVIASLSYIFLQQGRVALPAPSAPIAQIPSAPTPPSQVSSSRPAELSSYNGNDPYIAAQSLTEIPADATFTLSAYPDVRFVLRKVVKAAGGVRVSPSAPCGNYHGNLFIFVKDLDSQDPYAGLCLDVANATVENADENVFVADIQIENNGAAPVSGEFLQVFYSAAADQSNRIAHILYPPSIVTVRPFSSKRVLQAFAIPSNINEFRLVYGLYSGNGDGNDVATAGVGSYLVDFSKNLFGIVPG